MKTVTLAFAGFLVAVGTAGAQGPAAQNHPKAHTDQFLKQCMAATDNRPYCNCALNAFKKTVPAGRGRLESHDDYKDPVLKVDAEQLEALAPEIQRCKQRFDKRP